MNYLKQSTNQNEEFTGRSQGLPVFPPRPVAKPGKRRWEREKHKFFGHRLVIDFRYQSINCYRLSSIAIDCYRLSASSIDHAWSIIILDPRAARFPPSVMHKREKLLSQEWVYHEPLPREIVHAPPILYYCLPKQ